MLARRHVRLAGLAVVAVLVSCDDQGLAPPTEVSAPTLAIGDGAHGGNPDFFFLPPLAPDPVDHVDFDSDGFDASVTPEVRICQWTGTGCVTPLLAVYTMADGPGSETVRLDEADEQYVVNWHTREFSLDPALTYRIVVLVEGTELGFADVRVVSGRDGVTSPSTGAYVLLRGGRTLTIKFRIESGAVVRECEAVVLTPEDWSIPVGAQVQFSATVVGKPDALVEWQVDGVPGGTPEVGTVTEDGLYTAPAGTPASASVLVRATADCMPTVFDEAPVTVTAEAGPAQTRWWLWTPRAVNQTAVAEHAVLEVAFSGYPSYVLERPSGAMVTPTPVRSGVYAFEFSVGELLTEYHAGDLHAFVGYLHDGTGPRANTFVNVVDATVPSVTVTQLGAGVQVGSHVMNVRYDDPFYDAAIPRDILLEFYAHVSDAYDFVAVVDPLDTRNVPGAGGNRHYIGVRNDVTGLGLSVFDYGAAWGSATQLQGVVRFPIASFFDLAERSASHEIGHRWAVFLDTDGSFPPLNGGPHWAISSMAYGVMGFSVGSGSVGGTFPFNVVSVGGDVYELQRTTPAREFNDLELYLMGLRAPEDVAPHVVMDDQSIPRQDGSQGTGTVVTIDDIVAANGARDPDHLTAPTAFKMATIIVSAGRLLSAEEMRFFNHMAARGEATTELYFTAGFSSGMTKPFYLATGQRATLSTSVWP